AFDNRAVPWTKTQRQNYVTVSAPGVNVAALSKDGRVWPNGEGTSHAAALASGSFALIRSRFPNMSARDVVRLVTNTAVDIGPRGRDQMSGFGALSLRRALRQKVPANAPNPVYERLDRVLAQSASPSAGAGTSADDDGGGGGSGNLTLIAIVGAALVVIAVVGVPISIASDRRRKRRRNAPQPQPVGGPGMPPSFGAAPPPPPPGGAAPPYGQSPYNPPPPAQQPPYPPRQGE
ncbi:MAG TPA: S8 family serine peptidase, partial [Thermomonospora sp.]|nr:S8 family serine peptidase [Thermomonospora sp.]